MIKSKKRMIKTTRINAAHFGGLYAHSYQEKNAKYKKICIYCDRPFRTNFKTVTWCAYCNKDKIIKERRRKAREKL